jgi:hypothetical protein
MFCPGDRVRIVGWNGHAQSAVNGRLGTITEYHTGPAGDFRVKLDDHPDCPPFDILDFLPCRTYEMELVNAD